MSVMNMNSRMAMAEKLSVQQLQQAIQSGSIPSYIGIPLIEEKMKAQKQVPQQPAQRPIAQEVMEQASGIDSMPSNLPVSGYADGGIMAFAKGGEVDEEYEEYLENKEEAEYEDMIRKYMAQAEAAGIEGIPINRTKKVEQKYDEGGPIYEDTELFDIGTALDQARKDRRTAASNLRGLNPRADKFEFDVSQSQLNQLSDREHKLQNMYSEQMSTSREGQPANITDLLRARPNMYGRVFIPPSPNVPYAPSSAALLPTVTVTPETASPAAPASPATPATSEVDYSMNLQDGTGGPTLDPDAQYIAQDRQEGRTPVERAAPTGNQGTPQGVPSLVGAPRGSGSPAGETTRSERPKSAFDDFMADVKASRDDLKRQKQEDKYMALLSAGLGMMSGTSPNAFANIGQGAQAGVASYGASQKQRAAERSALNKNLLMGQRYQSMEDIANRTADISESRYRDIAAARGTGGDSKTEAELNRQENAFTGRLRNAELSVKAGLEARFGDPKLAAVINKEEYAAAVRELNRRYVDPVIILQNQFLSKRYPSVYGDQAPAPTAQPGNKPPLSSFLQR